MHEWDVCPTMPVKKGSGTFIEEERLTTWKGSKMCSFPI